MTTDYNKIITPLIAELNKHTPRLTWTLKYEGSPFTGGAIHAQTSTGVRLELYIDLATFYINGLGVPVRVDSPALIAEAVATIIAAEAASYRRTSDSLASSLAPRSPGPLTDPSDGAMTPCPWSVAEAALSPPPQEPLDPEIAVQLLRVIALNAEASCNAELRNRIVKAMQHFIDRLRA